LTISKVRLRAVVAQVTSLNVTSLTLSGQDLHYLAEVEEGPGVKATIRI
jgi:hypothetical protein